MPNWRKWHDGKQKRRARASKAATARWDAYHAAQSDEPLREDLPAIALRLTIEQPGIPRRILELRRRIPRGKQTHMFEAGSNCGPGGKCLLFRMAERTTHA